MDVEIASAKRIAVDANGGGNDVEAAYGLGRIHQQDPAAGLEHPVHLHQRRFEVENVLNDVERVDLVEVGVGEGEMPRVHHPQAWCGGVRHRFRIDVDADGGGRDLPYLTGEKPATAPDLEDTVARPRREEAADATERAIDFDWRFQKRVLAG